MKTFNVRLQLNADMIVGIEAKDEEDAMKELNKLTFDDITRTGYAIDYELEDLEIDNISEVHDRLKVKCTDIVYDLDDDEAAEVGDTLPTELVLEDVALDVYEGDIEEAKEEVIGDAITDKTGFCVESFKYEILEYMN